VLADLHERLATALISVRTAVDPVSPRRQVLRCEQEPAMLRLAAICER